MSRKTHVVLTIQDLNQRTLEQHILPISLHRWAEVHSKKQEFQEHNERGIDVKCVCFCTTSRYTHPAHTVDSFPPGGTDTISVYEAAVYWLPSNTVSIFKYRFICLVGSYLINAMEKFSFGSYVLCSAISLFQRIFFIFPNFDLYLVLLTLNCSIPPTIWCPFPTELTSLLTTHSWVHTQRHTQT